MLSIVHGDNSVASRQKLQELLGKFSHYERQFLNAEQLSPAELESALANSSLFNDRDFVLIENLFSLPKSKKKDQLINLLIDAEKDIICWEKKLLSVTALKKFPKAQVYAFKLSSKLWNFLDQLSPQVTNKAKQLKLLQEVLKQDGAELCFAMLLRQLRLLIKVKEGDDTDLAPFIRSKVQQQAKKFSLEKLIKMHEELFQIEKKMKTSKNLLGLGPQLDLFIVSM